MFRFCRSRGKQVSCENTACLMQKLAIEVIWAVREHPLVENYHRGIDKSNGATWLQIQHLILSPIGIVTVVGYGKLQSKAGNHDAPDCCSVVSTVDYQKMLYFPGCPASPEGVITPLLLQSQNLLSFCAPSLYLYETEPYSRDFSKVF